MATHNQPRSSFSNTLANIPTQVYLTVLLLLASALRIIASNQSFWLDEAIQAMMSRNPFIPGHFNGDFQPPLSYIITWAWMQVGTLLHSNSEWFLRLPNILLSVATVYIVYRFTQKIAQTSSALVAGLLLATAPFHIYYAHELRMYALLTLISISSWYALHSKKWLTLGILTALGLYTQYFMFVHLVAQCLYVIIFQKESRASFFKSTLIGFLPFVLWLPTFMIQLETSRNLLMAWPGWASVSNTGFFKFPGLVLAKFTVGMISPQPRWMYAMSVAIMGSILITTLVVGMKHIASSLHKRSIQQSLFLTLFMWIVPLILVWVGGLFISASSPWRIQFVLPALYMFIALIYEKFRQTSSTGARKGAVALLLVIVAQNTLWTSHYLLKPSVHRENWREAVAYTDSLAEKKHAIVISEFIGPWAPMQWYSQSQNLYKGGSTAQKMTTTSVHEALAPIMQSTDTIVLYTYLFEISDPAHLIEAELARNSYHLTAQKDFRGVGIINTYSRGR